MTTRSESKKAYWASKTPQERSVIMKERKRKGDAKRTPEQRSEHARKAARARWCKDV